MKRVYPRHEGRRGDRSGAPACRYEWAGPHMPMDARNMGSLLAGMRCPLCGGAEGVTAFDVREPTFAEAVQS